MKGLSFTILISLLILGSGCLDEPDCVSSATNFANVTFYKLDTAVVDTVDINSLTAAGSDSVLISDQDNVSTFKLPLNREATSSLFTFDIKNVGIKTLTLTYQVNQRLISEDCGVEIIISDLGYSQSGFDSIRVLNTILVEEIDEDIRIFN